MIRKATLLALIALVALAPLAEARGIGTTPPPDKEITKTHENVNIFGDLLRMLDRMAKELEKEIDSTEDEIGTTDDWIATTGDP